MSGKQSPFLEHRGKVLGYYGTASLLRAVVMALWNGDDYKVGLSRIASLDREHYEAFMAMMRQYRAVGEADPAFMALADDVRMRMREEEEAAQREQRLDEWLPDVKRALRGHGMTGESACNLVESEYDRLARLFDTGCLAADAAATVRQIAK